MKKLLNQNFLNQMIQLRLALMEQANDDVLMKKGNFAKKKYVF